jgi:hypothetical protein
MFKFKILSLPMLASTIWFLLTLAYYIVIIYVLKTHATSSQSMSTENATNMTGTVTMTKSLLNTSIQMAFIIAIFLLILLSPAVLGHFFQLNGTAMMQARFCWPKRGWLLGLSLVIYIVTESTTLVLKLLQLKQMSTLLIINWLLCFQLTNLTAGTFQFILLVLVSSRQTHFIKTVSIYATDRGKISSVSIITDILEDCNNIREGVGPMNILEFSIHVPIILCFSYLGIVDTVMRTIIGNVIWSCLILVHICLMADDCYDVLQSLLPSIRYLI